MLRAPLLGRELRLATSRPAAAEAVAQGVVHAAHRSFRVPAMGPE